jgi:hypothetical protein
MNTQDMYTLEKVNKIHLDEMYQEAQNRRMLREANRGSTQKSIAADRRQYVLLVIKALGALITTFLPRRVQHGSPSHL